MFSSCDALPYHWNPTSMAESVGLPLCNGSPTLNILTHRFSVPPISPVSKSCGDGGVAKRQVEMQLTNHPSCGRFTNVRTLLGRDTNWTGCYCSRQTALAHIYTICVICTRGRASPPSTVRQRTPPLSSLYPSENANFQCPDCARLCKSRIGLQSHSRTHK